jgi:hypothetical protein
MQCNFFVYYEVDDDEVPTALRLEEYGIEGEGGWVLLEAAAADADAAEADAGVEADAEAEAPTLTQLARNALDRAYERRGDALLEEVDAQVAALRETDAEVPTPQEQWDAECEVMEQEDECEDCQPGLVRATPPRPAFSRTPSPS